MGFGSCDTVFLLMSGCYKVTVKLGLWDTFIQVRREKIPFKYAEF